MMHRARLFVITSAVALASCRFLWLPLPPSPPLLDAGEPADAEPTPEPDADIDLTEPPPEPAMANALYTQARADIISGALDITSGLEIQLIASLDPNVTTFAEFDASHTHVNSIVDDASYLVSGKQSIPSIVYSDPGLDGGDMTGEAGWSDATYFPFANDLEWIHAMVIVKGTVPIAWIDVTSSQCSKAPLPIQDVDGNFLEIYWHASGIFDEDLDIVYVPSVCNNEAVRPSAIEANLVKPGATYEMVRP